jgi:aminomethyltransferase
MENSVSSDDPRLSPLDAVHVAAGASFTDFAGWKMPVRYGSDLAEHVTVRTAAGLFDLSHMAEFLVGGTHAAAFLDAALAGQASAITVGRAKYSLLLAEDGGILDDLVVYRLGDQRFWVVANAANHDVVAAALAERKADFDVTVDDETERSALCAVQGPRALEVLSRLQDLVLPEPRRLDGIPYYGIVEATYGETPVLVARTGYTGEDGFELYLDASAAPALWTDLVAAGAEPCGLAARDTLRLEAGMPLYGHELTRTTRPVEAGLGRISDLATPGARVLVGLAAEGKRAGRAGYPVLRDGAVIGEVTSGALSPTLGIPIAMAYVDADASAVGTELALDVRGTAIPARVVPLPFYSRKAAS